MNSRQLPVVHDLYKSSDLKAKESVNFGSFGDKTVEDFISWSKSFRQ